MKAEVKKCLKKKDGEKIAVNLDHIISQFPSKIKPPNHVEKCDPSAIYH